MKEKLKKGCIQNAAVIGLCFLLTSTGYLAWTYHVIELTPAPVSDVVTLIAAYLFQAAGIGLFSLLIHRRRELLRPSLYIALALHMLCLLPAVLGTAWIQVLVFGMSQNLCCGWIAGYYLYFLSTGTEASRRAMTLGIGYSISIFASWLLSLIGGGILYYSDRVLIISLFLTLAVLPLARRSADGEAEHRKTEPLFRPQHPERILLKRFCLLAAGLVLLFSVVNSCGFGFPSGDLRGGINVEFSRLFYAGGLLVAGFLNDWNRRYGAICALIALVVPFLMLALRGEPVSASIFWALSYFTFGFYSIFRMILFSDIAREKKIFSLSGYGLLFGRVGDALGETICLTLSKHFLLLVAVSAVLFMISALLFFRLYQTLYQPEAKAQRSERETFNRFSAKYDLSAREREVLRFLLEEKTNAEIAELLMIAEGTVKYHIHNLLQKTGCRNRTALLSAYANEQDA